MHILCTTKAPRQKSVSQILGVTLQRPNACSNDAYGGRRDAGSEQIEYPVRLQMLVDRIDAGG